MRICILGGAGFVGSHMVDKFLSGGDEVTAVDNFITSGPRNLAHLEGHPRFTFLQWDICSPIPLTGRFDAVFNMASPASPFDYAKFPLETMDVGSNGTRNGLELARRAGAVFIMASTSEIYGDPLEHPQRESYFGNVNTVGPRSCYDEAKRYSEALVSTYARVHKTPVRIARIFNTYGPRMREEDGRVIPAFIGQALENKEFTVFGDGSQTRSFCYVDDLVAGFVALFEKGDAMPVNLGNPNEMTLVQLADAVRKIAGSGGKVVSSRPLPENDPKQRKPDITRAQQLLHWQPRISLEEGLLPTVEFYRARRR